VNGPSARPSQASTSTHTVIISYARQYTTFILNYKRDLHYTKSGSDPDIMPHDALQLHLYVAS